MAVFTRQLAPTGFDPAAANPDLSSGRGFPFLHAACQRYVCLISKETHRPNPPVESFGPPTCAYTHNFRGYHLPNSRHLRYSGLDTRVHLSEREHNHEAPRTPNGGVASAPLCFTSRASRPGLSPTEHVPLPSVPALVVPELLGWLLMPKPEVDTMKG